MPALGRVLFQLRTDSARCRAEVVCTRPLGTIELGCEFVSPSAKATDMQKKQRHNFFHVVSSVFCFESILILLLHTEMQRK